MSNSGWRSRIRMARRWKEWMAQRGRLPTAASGVVPNCAATLPSDLPIVKLGLAPRLPISSAIAPPAPCCSQSR